MSIGLGENYRGGIIELLKNNITGKILDATQLSDEMITQKIFGDKLIEIATYIPEEHSGMSNSSTENLQVQHNPLSY